MSRTHAKVCEGCRAATRSRWRTCVDAYLCASCSARWWATGIVPGPSLDVTPVAAVPVTTAATPDVQDHNQDQDDWEIPEDVRQILERGVRG